MLISELIFEREGPTRKDCKRPASELSAYDLAHCKCKGWKERKGKKSHKLGDGDNAKRVKVGGKKIKGKSCGGPLPDYSD
jgi:hypothetical protein